jgi:hypothetical protein
MLFEQAFMALPEFLTGTPFKRYQFEGTVVTAFAMAVLQELNSRNVQNPISLLRSEVEYPLDRAKRADLHIDLQSLGLINDALKSYGYFDNNWLEAKYCRLGPSGSPVTTPLVSTYLLLKDLIRLCCLVPDTTIDSEYSASGRYLLHAYQRESGLYLVRTRKQHGRHVQRAWIDSLLRSGKQEVRVDDLNRENTKTFNSCIGRKARHLKIEATLTNLAHETRNGTDEVYYIVLTRIDDFKISFGRRCWTKRENGIMHESHNGHLVLLPKIISQVLTA